MTFPCRELTESATTAWGRISFWAQMQPLPTPNRGRGWNQRQQQTSATAVKPTAMRASTWPLLLPDAVCMARRITESQLILRSGLAPASTRDQPHDDDQYHENDQHQRHPRARHRVTPIPHPGGAPDAAAESRSPAPRPAGSRSRTQAPTPQASRPRSARRMPARIATAQRRPTSSGSRPPGQPTVRRWPGVRAMPSQQRWTHPPTSGRQAGWESMMSAWFCNRMKRPARPLRLRR